MWFPLSDYPGQLNLALTLRAGQVFCWEEQVPNEWVGAIGRTVYRLRQTPDDHVHFQYISETVCEDSARKELRKFFQLDVDLPCLMEKWKSSDAVFDRLVDSKKFSGLRICQQEFVECLISFIVSANNNIKRISQNLKSIRQTFGQKLHNTAVHAFPTHLELSTGTIEQFKALGLGYRARYIFETVQKLENYLPPAASLPTMRTHLLEFPGVGRKVADCVLLYSLGFHSVVPVDTHMLQIAQTLAGRAIKKDNAMHEAVEVLMAKKFGEKAGWAHCYLFAADLVPSVSKRKRVN